MLAWKRVDWRTRYGRLSTGDRGEVVTVLGYLLLADDKWNTKIQEIFGQHGIITAY